MNIRFCVLLMMAAVSTGVIAQGTTDISYSQARQSPPMRWACPEMERSQGFLYSLRDDDPKVYAENVMRKIGLHADPAAPGEKYILAEAVLEITNALFSTEDLLGHISSWIRNSKDYKVWGKGMKVNTAEGSITATATVPVASNASFLNVNKVSVSPAVMIQVVGKDMLMVSFMADRYNNGEYDGKGSRLERTFTPKISEVFPFDPKSSHKNTYAKAYVGTYLYFWTFVSEMVKDLNTNFTRDAKMLAGLRYEHSKDSLHAKYGEPTKVIRDQTTTPDIYKEMYVYEKAQTVVFMDKTIAFRDILSCEIVDDPKFIPGHTTAYGAGFSIFGIGIGGAEAYRTPDKTIHSYVVKVKIDSLATPLIYIATGQDEQKAEEIASVFEYIIRHQEGGNTATQRSQVTRKTKR